MNNISREERITIFNDLMGKLLDDDKKLWLIKNGFFDSPASCKYHGSFEGGLFEHSINVALSLLELTENNNLVWERKESPYIIGMFHDICKMDQYKWNPVLKKYEWNSDQVILGHGDKSVKIINDNLIELTDEEIACITYHMGAFDKKENWTNYCNAIHKYPNVLWTHTSDMIASHVLEQNQNEEK